MLVVAIGRLEPAAARDSEADLAGEEDGQVLRQARCVQFGLEAAVPRLRVCQLVRLFTDKAPAGSKKMFLRGNELSDLVQINDLTFLRCLKRTVF